MVEGETWNVYAEDVGQEGGFLEARTGTRHRGGKNHATCTIPVRPQINNTTQHERTEDVGEKMEEDEGKEDQGKEGDDEGQDDTKEGRTKP